MAALDARSSDRQWAGRGIPASTVGGCSSSSCASLGPIPNLTIHQQTSHAATTVTMKQCVIQATELQKHPAWGQVTHDMGN